MIIEKTKQCGTINLERTLRETETNIPKERKCFSMKKIAPILLAMVLALTLCLVGFADALSPRDGRSLSSECYVLPGLRFLRIQVRHMDCGRGRVAPVLPRVVGDKALSSGESDFCTAKWRGPCSRVPLTVSRTCEKQQPRALKTALGCCFCPFFAIFWPEETF